MTERTEPLRIDTTKVLPRFITQEELTAKLGITLETARRWVDKGFLPKPRRIERRFFWVAKEVEAYIEKAVA